MSGVCQLGAGNDSSAINYRSAHLGAHLALVFSDAGLGVARVPRPAPRPGREGVAEPVADGGPAEHLGTVDGLRHEDRGRARGWRRAGGRGLRPGRGRVVAGPGVLPRLSAPAAARPAPCPAP